MKDGGPIIHGGFIHNEGEITSNLSLRDYFAAKAMQGFLASGNFAMGNTDKSWQEACAKKSYLYADAMLAAREGK